MAKNATATLTWDGIQCQHFCEWFVGTWWIKWCWQNSTFLSCVMSDFLLYIEVCKDEAIYTLRRTCLVCPLYSLEKKKKKKIPQGTNKVPK